MIYWAYTMHGEMRNTCRRLVWKPGQKPGLGVEGVVLLKYISTSTTDSGKSLELNYCGHDNKPLGFIFLCQLRDYRHCIIKNNFAQLNYLKAPWLNFVSELTTWSLHLAAIIKNSYLSRIAIHRLNFISNNVCLLINIT